MERMKLQLPGKNLLFFFIVISTLLRLFSFFPSVLDHDESTYMIIGRDILNGKSLYTDVTDTKPVGIFLFYAFLEFLFGGSIFMKRLVFAIIVGITAYLISKASKKMFDNNKVAFASGLIYIIYTSTWTLHGRSPNTELLFNLTTISTLLLFLNGGKFNFFLGGLVTGLGFIIKYLVLFDLAAFMLFFFIVDIINNREIIRKASFWMRYILAGTGFLIPFGLVNLWFWLSGKYDAFYFITFELPSNYGSNPSMKRYLTMLLDFTAKFLPISYMFFSVV
jgi:4-amino-4-deoxy-L-arabinose transferase-like glycosyltransferase